MKQANIILRVLTLSVILFSAQSAIAAPGEAKLVVKSEAPITDTLEAYKGKVVIIRLTSGEEISGTVGELGDNAVSLTQLTGKEFYDAVVALDQVAAIIVKTR